MSKIARDQIEHIAHLARLSLTEEEKNRFSAQLSVILDHVEELNKIRAKKIEPISQISGLKNVLRDDNDQPGLETLDRDEVLRNTGDKERGYIEMRSIF